jgi:hypothetical protein
MDLLVTVIGNAIADPAFCERLLVDPRGAIDEWGFRLTKGEQKMLDAMFTKGKKEKLAKGFESLQGMLLEEEGTKGLVVGCTTRRCPGFGCYPPASQKDLRETLDTLKNVA